MNSENGLGCHCYRCAAPGVERELVGQLGDFAADAFESGIVVALVESLGDPCRDGAHLGLFHAARGECGRADADAGGLERRIGVLGNGVLVDGDAGLAEGELGFGAEDAFLEDIDEHEVVVGSAGDDAEARVLQALCEDLGVGDDLRGVGAELGTQRLSEGDGLGGDDMHERAALLAGEDSLVDGGGEILAADDEAGARSAQGFVRGGGGDVRVRHRRRMDAAGDQAGDVGHVEDVVRANLVCDLAHAGEVPEAGIGAASADDDLGLFADGDGFELVVVDESRCRGGPGRRWCDRACR